MANRRPVFLTTTGILSPIAAPDAIDPAILTGALRPASVASSGAVSGTTGTFSGAVGMGTGANAIAFAAGFSSVFPTLGNTSDGGLNASVAASSTLGFRFFKYDGTTLSQLFQITPAGAIVAPGALMATGGVVAGSGTVQAAGDLQTGRSANVGAVEFGSSATNRGLLYYDGTNYAFYNPGIGAAEFQIAAASGSVSSLGSFAFAGIYNSIGTSAGNGVLQVPGSGVLFFNLTSGNGVQFGNGASGIGASISAAGALAAASAAIAGTLVVGGSGPSGLAAGDAAFTRSGGTSGAVFFGTSQARYLYYDGSNYYLPGASLYVNGTVYASSRALKHAVAPIAFDSVAKIKQLAVVSFKYRPEANIGGATRAADNNQETHHGIIAEDTPPEFLSADGKGLAAHTSLAIALDAIKQLTLRIEQLESAKKAA